MPEHTSKNANIGKVVAKQLRESLKGNFSTMSRTTPAQQLVPCGRTSSLSNQLLYSEDQAGSQSDVNQGYKADMNLVEFSTAEKHTNQSTIHVEETPN